MFQMRVLPAAAAAAQLQLQRPQCRELDTKLRTPGERRDVELRAVEADWLPAVLGWSCDRAWAAPLLGIPRELGVPGYPELAAVLGPDVSSR